MNKADVAKLYAEETGEEALARELRAAAAKCRSCGAAMRWVRGRAGGSPMPVDYDPHEDGNVVVFPDGRAEVYRDTPRRVPDGATLHFSHFATCPNADAHRSPKPEPQATALF